MRRQGWYWMVGTCAFLALLLTGGIGVGWLSPGNEPTRPSWPSGAPAPQAGGEDVTAVWPAFQAGLAIPTATVRPFIEPSRVSTGTAAVGPSGPALVAALPQGPAEPGSAPPGRAPRQAQDYVWVIETVDGEGNVGEYTSLALDSAGRPHISYCELIPGTGRCTALKYAHHDGTSWIIEVVDDVGETGYDTSLALDSAGRPHIAYMRDVDYETAELKYAHHDGTAWVTETLASGGSPSLVLDASDRPHIAYSGDEGLLYARYDGAAWHVETVEGGIDTGWSPSLALDASERPHVSYGSGAPGTYLHYAYRGGLAWHVETVDFTGESGAPTSLALDSSGHPHIGYTTGGPMVGSWQMYAYHDGQDWHTEMVEDDSGVGALALDDADYPHIAYDNWKLKYAYYDGTAWVSETADSSVDVTAYISLALDAAGRAHISYYAWYPIEDLKYAYQCTPVDEVAIAGPDPLPLGVGGLYSATGRPATASLPLTYTWSSGAAGPTAVYSWTAAGAYTVGVTATNPCGQAVDTLTVTVFCQPLAGVEIAGPPVVLAGETHTYQAVPQPLTASRPLTFTWGGGAVGPTAAYSWTMTGTYTVTVTATNVCGGVREAALPVRVLAEWPYHLYLPLVRRGW